MYFDIDKKIFKQKDRFTSESDKGKFGVLGGKVNEIIDDVIWPRITGGCEDNPSISYKNMAEVFVEFIKRDKIIRGFIKYRTMWNIRWHYYEEKEKKEKFAIQRVGGATARYAIQQLCHNVKYPIIFIVQTDNLEGIYLGGVKGDLFNCPKAEGELISPSRKILYKDYVRVEFEEIKPKIESISPKVVKTANDTARIPQIRATMAQI